MINSNGNTIKSGWALCPKSPWGTRSPDFDAGGEDAWDVDDDVDDNVDDDVDDNVDDNVDNNVDERDNDNKDEKDGENGDILWGGGRLTALIEGQVNKWETWFHRP